MSKVSERLREVILEIRRKPYPIADLIPLLDKAATELEACDKLHEKLLKDLTK